MSSTTIRSELVKGFFKENPVFVLLLGMCPTLGVTSSAINGLGMGLATLAVLLGSNIVVALIKNLIPEKVRIPAFIVIIASFVTIIDFTMAAFLPALHAQLGLFIPLIVVNCIILGRAEAFASKNTLFRSIVDALSMGLGFAFALTLLGATREILGAGEFFGLAIPWLSDNPMLLFIMPPGAFIALGFLTAAVNTLRDKAEAAANRRDAARAVAANAAVSFNSGHTTTGA
jgi:electron transport complex protein RnfE